MFEPFFDQYLASVIFSGGKPVYVPLHPNLDDDKPSSADWTIDFDELRCVDAFSLLINNVMRCSRAITSQTKMIIVNTPHNPVGKVFTKDELKKIAALAKEFNLLVMADEVVCTIFLPLGRHLL